MKQKHLDWMKLTANDTNATQSPALTRVLNLPGFRKIEDMLLLYPPHHGELQPAVEAAIDGLSRDTFGITTDDTLFDVPDGYDELPDWSRRRWAIRQAWNKHEAQFETEVTTDDEAVVLLSRLGLDFTDERGRPLRSTKWFCRQAEAAAKGLMGRMPDRDTADVKRFGTALEEAARQFMASKRKT